MNARAAGRIAWFHSTAVGLLAAGALLGLLLPLVVRLPLRGALGWAADLAVHWQWSYALLLALACIAGAWRHRKWLFVLPLCALPWLTASRALPDAGDAAPALRVAVANVHVSRTDPAALLRWVDRQPVDLLAIVELSPGFANALQAGPPPGLRHWAAHPMPSPWGLGVWSRFPLHDVRVLTAADGVPRLQARLDIGGRPVRVVVVHPMPPMNQAMQRHRDDLLQAVAHQVASDDTPTVVLGDFNATPWSRPLRDAASSHLLRGTGLAPTWPASWTLRPGIPIDHVLASRHWTRGANQRGPDIASDHRPVRVDLHWMRASGD